MTGMDAQGDELLTTGQMSAASGLSLKALRLYHANGLLEPARVDESSGYRGYHPDQVPVGRMIARLRDLDMPLATIGDVVSAEPLAARERILAWSAQREREVAQRTGTIANLASLPAATESAVAVRQVPAVVVAALRTTVEPRTIGESIRQAARTVRQFLDTQPVKPAEELWVLYFDPVSPGVDVQVEVCIPYTGSAQPAADVVLRAEPGGREVFVPVRARDVGYPSILPAYAAVMAHAATLGGPVGAPREIYPAAWPDDAEDIAADVAVRVAS